LPICEAFFQAGQELGIPFNADFNGKSQEGLGYYQLTQYNAAALPPRWPISRRFATAKISPVQLGAQALRVVIEKGRASGIEIAAAGGAVHSRRTRSHLASGAIGSPKLLMQSGIGPADHLRVRWHPVLLICRSGRNLQDHLDLFVIAECTGDHTYDKYNRPHHAAWAGLQYLLWKKGR
jgi:choline dehydrogenase-like flavoprotein